MEQQIQFFEIGNLIFSFRKDKVTSIQSDEVAHIQSRFKYILGSFTTPEIHYASGFVKGTKTKLPYASMTIIGQLKEHLVLHFAFSYKEPVLFIVDTKNNLARNYIDIEVAKDILDDNIFEDIKSELHYPKNLNHLFKSIRDINTFVDRYKQILEEHNNPQCITGRECFEIEL